MDLTEIRAKINDIDDKILSLFFERMEYVTKISKIKAKNNIPVINKNREKEILTKIYSNAKKYKDESVILFSNIMAISKFLQEKEMFVTEDFEYTPQIVTDDISMLPQNDIIACQGIKGSFSSHVAKDFFKTGKLYFYETFKDICEAVSGRAARFGVLPVENTFSAVMDETYELIKNHNLFIIGTVEVKLKTSFIVRNKNNETSIKLKDHIIDETKFAVVSRDIILQSNANKISVSFSTTDIKTTLNTITTHLIASNTDIIKLESRLSQADNKNYFYMEFYGNIQNKETAQLISCFKNTLDDFLFLGNYSTSKLMLKN